MVPSTGERSSITGAVAPNRSATRLIIVRNSILAKNASRSSGTASLTSRLSRSNGNSIAQSNCTRFLDNSIWARLFSRLSRRLGCLISSARSSNVSKSPYSFINNAAVLIPIPGAPGTLSTLSPANACTSTTRSGPTPNFSRTPSLSMSLFFIGSSISTPPPTNCIKSLSDDKIVTRPPALRPWWASVAMMSSASNPSISSQAILKARVASRVRGICGRKSSGIASRLALYWSYISLRNVWLPLSKITAT